MAQTGRPLNKIRRHSCAKEDGWIEAFLRRGAMGTLASSVEGQPFLVTRNFAYDPERHAIYLHGARAGRTYENIQVNDSVCFNVSEMGRLLPAEEAMEFGVEYAGVVVFGRVRLVDDPQEAAHGLVLLLDKYFPQFKAGEDYQPVSPESLKITAVLRIDIESWSGKEKKAEDDFPGAFYFDTVLDTLKDEG